jgi:hypothetical protein
VGRPQALGARLGLWLALAGCTSSRPGGADGGAADRAAPAVDAPGAEEVAGPGDDGGAASSCGEGGPGNVWANWPMPDPAAGSAALYDTASAEVAVDRVTGLGWQRGVAGGMFDWRRASEYCGCLVLGGHDDWRLPTRIELVTLVDFTRQDPAIDGKAFPDTPFEWFWTSSRLAGSDPPAAWYLGFFDGDTHHASLDTSYRVRCVRGGAGGTAPRYAIAGDTVADKRTGLTWQRAVDPGRRTWADARSYCAGLPLAGGGWRLPDMKALQTLIDESRTDPAIDVTAFPQTPGEGFWALPALAGQAPFAWFVSFESGIAYNSDAGHLYSVRCVR